MIPLFGAPDAGDKRGVLEGRFVATALRELRRGRSVILDFGLWGRDERSALRWLATRLGVDVELIHLPIEFATQRERTRDRFAATRGGVVRSRRRAWRDRTGAESWQRGPGFRVPDWSSSASCVDGSTDPTSRRHLRRETGAPTGARTGVRRRVLSRRARRDGDPRRRVRRAVVVRAASIER